MSHRNSDFLNEATQKFLSDALDLLDKLPPEFNKRITSLLDCLSNVVDPEEANSFFSLRNANSQK